MILAAFTYKGEGSPTLAERAKQLDYYRTHNRRLRDRAMIRSIFTRDKAGTSDPAVGEFAGRSGTQVRRSGADRHISGHDRATCR